MRKIVLMLCMAKVISTAYATDVIEYGKCGNNCVYTLDVDGNVVISALKEGDEEYQAGIRATCDRFGEELFPNKRLKSVTIQDGITYIGSAAFYGNNIDSVVISDTVSEIDEDAFSKNNITSLVLPSTLYHMGNTAFGSNNLRDISISDETYFGNTDVFEKNYNLEHIYCRGNLNECKNNMIRDELDDLDYMLSILTVADEKHCAGTNYYWSGVSCNNKKSGITCAENWKRNEDFCNRIRWTPAEAAKVLRDDNTNEVTITFKK